MALAAWPDSCLCGHQPVEHVNSTGRCRARDSYEQPCECPSFERDPNLDDDPDDSDDFDEERRRLERRHPRREEIEEC
jgi:hypothetical protein